ncbi:MerR family transcriptional regulator [Vagococcus acidifermentans]|uniref:HTH merR-type domain-containing protein n=1 Tax=Vagococcus acidifermentans TaxID=564710 RepID=A0A430AZ58_9ENTE|nr:MerR family transcriptional regulator [Vagococcus acidifermentans]RSU13341.1 hypothetical protein CBF27_03950 [Vagococcus acidifermentans]
MFKIGHFSKLSHTSVRMLRYYEQIDLLQPDNIDTDTGYRYYSAGSLKEIGKIKKLQELGFSLSEIKPLMTATHLSEIQSYIAIRRAQLTEELARVTTQAKMLESMQTLVAKNSDSMSYNVVCKELAARDVMSIRRVVPDESHEALLWQELYHASLALQVALAQPPLGITVYHDEEYKDDQIDIEVQSSVAALQQSTEEVVFKHVPPVTVASVTFHGGFEQMPLVMEALAHWVEDNDYQLYGPMFNISHVSPAQDSEPKNWITEACITIKQRGDE